MAIGSVGSSPDFTPLPAPEMEAPVESSPAPIMEEAPAITAVQDSSNVSTEAQQSDSAAPFSSISDSQDSHLEAMRANFGKPADAQDDRRESEPKTTIELAPSLADKKPGQNRDDQSPSPKVQSFQQEVSRLDSLKTSILEPGTDRIGDGVETLKSELTQAEKQKDESFSTSDERVRKDSLKLEDIRSEIARREAYQSKFQPDTRFRGDLLPQSWNKDTQDALKPETTEKVESTLKTPFSSNPWENSVLKGISALGPLSERLAKLPAPPAEAPTTRPEPLAGLLKPSERPAGPNTRLPGDQSNLIPAARTEEKGSEEAPAKEGLPQVLERLDALSRSVSSQFSALSDKFQLSIGKLGELRSNPLTPPVPGQSRTTEESARKTSPETQPDSFLVSTGKALLGPVGSSLLGEAGDWLKQTFTTEAKSDSLQGSLGSGGSSLLAGAGDWLKQTFSTNSQGDSLLGSAGKALLGPVGSSLLGGAGDWLKQTFTTESKSDSLLGSSSLLGGASDWLKQTFSGDGKSSSLLAGAGDWLKQTLTTNSQSESLLGSASKALIGPVGSSLLGGAGDWLKQTFTTNSQSDKQGASSSSLLAGASDWLKQTLSGDGKSSSLLAGAGDWLKQTFSTNSQSDSLLGSAGKALIGPVGSSLLGGAGDWLKQTFTTDSKSDNLSASSSSLLSGASDWLKQTFSGDGKTSSLLAGAGDWLKQTFSTNSQSDSLLGSAGKALLGPVGSSLLGGAGDWLKQTFTTDSKSDNLGASSSSLLSGASDWLKQTFSGDGKGSSLLAGAGDWLKQTFSTNSQSDSLLGSAGKALLGPVGSSLLGGAGDWLKQTFTTDSKSDNLGASSSSLLSGASDWLKQTFSGDGKGSSLLAGAGDWLKQTFSTNSQSDSLLGSAGKALLGPVGSSLLGEAGDWLKQTFTNSQSDSLLGSAGKALLGPVGSSLLGGAGDLLKQGDGLLSPNLLSGSNAELATGSAHQALNWVAGPGGAQNGSLPNSFTPPSLAPNLGSSPAAGVPQPGQFKSVEAWAEATQEWAASKSLGMTPASLAPANFSNLNAWSSAVENFQSNKSAPAEAVASPLALPESKSPWQATPSLPGPWQAAAPGPQTGPILSNPIAPTRLEGATGEPPARGLAAPAQADRSLPAPMSLPTESRSFTSPATAAATGGGSLGSVGSASVGGSVVSEKTSGSGGSPSFLGGTFRQPEPPSNPNQPLPLAANNLFEMSVFAGREPESLSLQTLKTNLESAGAPSVAQSLGANAALRNANQLGESGAPTPEADLSRADRPEPAFALKRTAFSQQRDHQRDSNRSSAGEDQKSGQHREEKEKEEKNSSSSRSQKSQESETPRKQQAPTQQQRQTPQQRLAQQQGQAKKQASSHKPKSGWSAEDHPLEKECREACGQCGHQIDSKGSACLICSSAKVRECEELVA